MSPELPSQPLPSRLGWVVVAGVLFIQFALFRQLVLREIEPVVPLAYDQSDYLTRAYQTCANGSFTAPSRSCCSAGVTVL